MVSSLNNPTSTVSQSLKDHKGYPNESEFSGYVLLKTMVLSIILYLPEHMTPPEI